MSALQSILSGIMPILSPLIINVWESDLKPQIVAEIAKLGPDLQVAANAELTAIDAIIQAEVPKI